MFATLLKYGLSFMATGMLPMTKQWLEDLVQLMVSQSCLLVSKKEEMLNKGKSEILVWLILRVIGKR